MKRRALSALVVAGALAGVIPASAGADPGNGGGATTYCGPPGQTISQYAKEPGSTPSDFGGPPGQAVSTECAPGHNKGGGGAV